MKILYPFPDNETSLDIYGVPGSDDFMKVTIVPARNGQAFEAYLNYVCNWLNVFGYHAHKNHSKWDNDRNLFVDGEPFDYEIFWGARVQCFDAKEHLSVEYPDCWQIRYTGARGKKILKTLWLEICHLSRLQKNSIVDAYFLVYMHGIGKIIKFNVETVRESLLSGEKILSASQGSEWTIYDLIPRLWWRIEYIKYCNHSQEFIQSANKIPIADFENYKREKEILSKYSQEW